MSEEFETVETTNAVCSLIYKAIRDTEASQQPANHQTVQKMLDLYKEECKNAKNISSLVVDIVNAKSVLQEFEKNNYTIEEVKQSVKQVMRESEIKLVEEQLR
ncbi:MAG: hypothetical protein ACI4TI_03410 [Christensenellales bacterium]